jgi:hypothetical protein
MYTPPFHRRWPGPGIGRYWKRRLSKARRRYARALCRYEAGRALHLPRMQTGIESIVNWKSGRRLI